VTDLKYIDHCNKKFKPPNFTWNALLTFSGLSDDRIYSSMMEYPLLSTVQNRTKTNDKQMA
jgi:hypothetical protein